MTEDVADLSANVLATLAADGLAVVLADIFEADPRWAVDDDDLDEAALKLWLS